ncbi:unnamed protein product [Aphanomyces euteiches]
MVTPNFDSFFANLAVIRRNLHENPELSFQEFKTQALVRDYLINEAKIPEEQIHVGGKTGLAVDIFGPTDDLDALPMTERNPHLPYESKAPGAAHMCGHDGHTANLMGFATLVQQRRHLLPPHSTIRLLFQPAEEGHFGAPAMIKDGCLEGVNQVYGYHNSSFPLGNIQVKAVSLMAHLTFFKISGPGGHGSAPHATKDPIVAAGQLIVALQTITSRSWSLHDAAIVSVCQVHGVVVNPETETSIFQTIAAGVVGASKVSDEGLPICGAEDFSYFLQERPGCFFFIGTKDENDTQNRNCHSDTFDFNDAILPLGARVFLEIIHQRLHCALYTPEELQEMTADILKGSK